MRQKLLYVSERLFIDKISEKKMVGGKCKKVKWCSERLVLQARMVYPLRMVTFAVYLSLN